MKNRFVAKTKFLIFLYCLFTGWAGGALYARDFSQKLKWNNDPNVLEYKVEIQDASRKIISSEITEETEINLSLTEGSYKYKITAYDLLGREAVSTRWVSFEVLVANQPAIVHNQSLEALQEDGKTLEINLNVEDVTKDSIAELININDGSRIRGSLILSSNEVSAVTTLSGSEKHKANKARFTDVPEGMWKLVITNPSGLSSESQSFEVRDIIKEQKLAAAKAEEERLAREKAEAEERARLEAERLAREEAERKEREDAERLAKEELERLERERQEAERIALEEERARFEEEERLAREAKEEEEARLALEEKQKEETANEDEEVIEEIDETKTFKYIWNNYDRKFYLIAGAGLSMVLYDEGFFEDYMNDRRMFPTLTAQIGYMPYHTPIMRLGTELNSIFTTFNSKTEYYEMNFNMISIQDNFVFRINTRNQKFGMQMKAGAGMVILQERLDYFKDTENNNKKDKLQNLGYLTAGGGLSLIYTPFKMLTLELGADFYNLFIPNMNIGMVIPYLGIGFRF